MAIAFMVVDVFFEVVATLAVVAIMMVITTMVVCGIPGGGW